MTQTEALRLALEVLESNRRTHYYCEDTWYSCPKHEDGCANDSEGDECNCGADEVNAEIDQAITAIKAALEAKDEPVAWRWGVPKLKDGTFEWRYSLNKTRPDSIPLYAAPPQRKPLTDEEIERIYNRYGGEMINCAKAIERAHGIKGEA